MTACASIRMWHRELPGARAGGRGDILSFATVVALVLVGGGCGSDSAEKSAEAVPTQVVAEIAAASDVNPDIDGNPSPIQLRLYELSAAAAFNGASFFPLYDNDQAVLGKDLQAREDVIVKPGQRLRISREANKNARFLGVIAAFQDLENATWRSAAPLSLRERNSFAIDVDRLKVAIKTKNTGGKQGASNVLAQ